MKIALQEDKVSQTITVSVEGSVDTLTAPELEEFIISHFEACKKIILDFAAVTYISSAGLRVLLKADKMMGGNEGFALQNVNSDVREVLELTGFSEIVSILP